MAEIDDDADVLVATYDLPPNGFGVHSHPERGSTDTQLWRIYQTHGKTLSRAEIDRAIDAAFKRLNAKKREAR